MRIVFLLLSLFSFLFSNIIEIGDEVNLKNFELEYHYSKKQEHSIENIHNEKFLPIKSKESLGAKKSIWFRMQLQNTTEHTQEIYVSYRNVHILRTLEFFTLKNSKLVEQLFYDNYNDIEIDNRIGNIVYYKVKLDKHESATVYIKTYTNSQIYYDIEVNDFKHYSQNLISSSVLMVFLSGLLIAQGLYYLFLYFSTPYKEYIYFSLFVVSIAIWGFYVYGGLAHYLGIFGKSVFIFNVFIFLFPVFTMLFFKSIFLRNNEFKKIKIVLNSMIFILLAIAAFFLVTVTPLIDGISVVKYMPLVHLTQLLIFFFITLYMYMKGVKLIGYFLVGYGINVITSLMAIAFFLGMIEYNEFNFHISSIGAVIESLLFSVLLSYRIGEIHKVAQETEHKLEIQTSVLFQMKEVIQNIAHQWRQPLAQINASVFMIDNELEIKKISNKRLEIAMNDIENTTKYMSTTINDFMDLYKPSLIRVDFYLNEVILETRKLILSSLVEAKIELILDLEEDILFSGDKNEFSQTILIFINNAKDAFLEKQIINKQIIIKLYREDSKTMLSISDNAGGIDSEIIDRIFNPYFTTKDKTQGSGLGLYIAKTIIENKMNSKLGVSTTDKGTCFHLELKS